MWGEKGRVTTTELCDALAANQSGIIYGRLAWIAKKS